MFVSISDSRGELPGVHATNVDPFAFGAKSDESPSYIKITKAWVSSIYLVDFYSNVDINGSN